MTRSVLSPPLPLACPVVSSSLSLSLILLYLTAGRIPRIDVVVDDDDRSSLSFIVHREMHRRNDDPVLCSYVVEERFDLRECAHTYKIIKSRFIPVRAPCDRLPPMAMTSRDVLPANKIDVEVDGASPFVRRLRADVVLIRFPSARAD